MPTTDIFLNRYTPETVKLAEGLLESFRAAGLLKRDNSIGPWKTAFDWLCDNGFGVDMRPPGQRP